jgi:integrase
VRITPEEGSNPRLFKMSSTILAMLQKLPKNEQVFSHYKNLANLHRTFERYRCKSAQKFGNPRLQQITFHTLRH